MMLVNLICIHVSQKYTGIFTPNNCMLNNQIYVMISMEHTLIKHSYNIKKGALYIFLPVNVLGILSATTAASCCSLYATKHKIKIKTNFSVWFKMHCSDISIKTTTFYKVLSRLTAIVKWDTQNGVCWKCLVNVYQFCHISPVSWPRINEIMELALTQWRT